MFVCVSETLQNVLSGCLPSWALTPSDGSLVRKNRRTVEAAFLAALSVLSRWSQMSWGLAFVAGLNPSSGVKLLFLQTLLSLISCVTLVDPVACAAVCCWSATELWTHSVQAVRPGESAECCCKAQTLHSYPIRNHTQEDTKVPHKG